MDNNFSKILNIFKRLDENRLQGENSDWYDANGRPSESVEECGEPMTLSDRLRARWEETKKQKGLQEYGAVGATNSNAPAPQDPKARAALSTQLQQATSKLKVAGANIPNPQQAVKSMLKDPVKDPVTPQDKQVAGGLGQEMEKVLTKGDPSTINQLATLIKKVNQGGAQ